MTKLDNSLPDRLEDKDSRLLCASLNKIQDENTPYYIHFNACPEPIAEKLRKELTRRYNNYSTILRMIESLYNDCEFEDDSEKYLKEELKLILDALQGDINK